MLIAAGSAFWSRETAATPIGELGGPYLAGTARRREAEAQQPALQDR
jgi:hypothetical protein